MDLDTDLVVRHEGRPGNEAPTLVLLHGLTDSGAGWSDAIAEWGADFSLLIVDQRGHGDSPRFTQEQLDAHPGEVMVEDAIGILSQLGSPPVLVGHSLGGAVALAAGARRPDLVRALVLEDPAPLGPEDEQRDPSRGEEFLEGVRESLEAKDEEELLRLRQDKHPDWGEEELLATGLAEQQMDLAYLALGDYKPSTPWPELFKELMVPALLISGDAMDEVCIDASIEEGIAELENPNVTLVRVPASAHCIRREQPQRFYQLVADFLARR